MKYSEFNQELMDKRFQDSAAVHYGGFVEELIAAIRHARAINRSRKGAVEEMNRLLDKWNSEMEPQPTPGRKADSREDDDGR
jgi:hypothetical protein